MTDEHDGASIKEQLIAACRGNNTDLLEEILEGKPDDEITKLLNETTTVMGNHLYHEAALRGNYEIIDLLLDQPLFECDPITRLTHDTPLHSAISWLNAEPPAQQAFGQALITMMLEAGSNPQAKNKGGLTPLQLVDPRNEALKDVIRKFEFVAMNAGDYINADENGVAGGKENEEEWRKEESSEEEADFSGSDEDEREEWERRRREKRKD